jgi:Dolichyl-phosphate-mannose-protein mannosyltransferase
LVTFNPLISQFRQALFALESKSKLWRYFSFLLVIVAGIFHYERLLHWSKITPFNFDAISTYIPFAQKLLNEGPSFLLSEQAVQVPVFAFIFPAIFGADLEWQKQLHMVLSVLVVFLVYRTCCLVHSRAAGLVAAVAYAATPNLFPYLATAGIEPLFVFLVAVWIWALAEGQIGKRWWYVAAGIALGLATLTRATILYFLPLIILISWWQSRRSILDKPFWKGVLLAHAISMAMVLPVLVKNILLFGLPAISTGAGIALWLGNHPLTYGMEPSYFNIISDHPVATVSGSSHLSVASDRSLAALARYVLLDQPGFILELYWTKLQAFLFVTNREWIMPTTVLRPWRVVLIGLAFFSLPLATKRPLVLILWGYFLFQVAIHIPALCVHRYSASAIDMPLAILGALGFLHLIFHSRIWVAIISMLGIYVSAVLGNVLARDYHYPQANIDRVPHEVLASFDQQNLPLKFDGFIEETNGSITQTRETAFVELDLMNTSISRYQANLIAIDLRSIPIEDGACRHVYMQYRGVTDTGYSETRAFNDKWYFEPQMRIIIGGHTHIRVDEPGILKIKFQCPGLNMSFLKLQIIRPTVALSYRDRYFKKTGVTSWDEWAAKR